LLFVTGASGLLGSNILVAARDKNMDACGQYWEHLLNVPGTTSYKLDLRDFDSTRRVLGMIKPKAVIHCAAATNVDWCEDHPQEANLMNSDVAASLAEAANSHGTRFVHVSTDAVFDGKRGNYSEHDATGPINVYAESKLQGEQGVLKAHPEALIVRVNIYGWNAQPKTSIAEWVLRELSAGKHVPGFIDVWFCPTLVNDLAEIIFEMVERGLNGIYHVAGSEKISKYDFARKVAETFNFDPTAIVPTRMADAKLRAARSPDMSLDTGKLRQALGRSLPDVGSGLLRFRQLRDNGYMQRLKNYAGTHS
jgi:dTDP-4-dehydrorhamnose reductase